MFKNIKNWIKNIFNKNEKIEETCECNCTSNKSVEINEPAVIDDVKNENECCEKEQIICKEIENNMNNNEKNLTVIENKIEKTETVKKNVVKKSEQGKGKVTKNTNMTTEKVEIDKPKTTQPKKARINSKKVEKVEKASAESQQQEKVEKPKRKTTRKTVKKDEN